MNYNFDEIVDRRNTNSLKYDFAEEYGKPANVLPLWIADMDFRTPPEVTAALKDCAEHGIFGYTEVKEDYFNLVRSWFKERFDFDIKQDWLVKTPGVVFAIATAINAFTDPADAVLIQQPVYYPFAGTIRASGRKVANNSLVYENGAYRIDFEDFERKIVENRVKLFILCSPHNPVGRVWSVEELTRIGDICLKHNCLVVSDEIHCDFVYSPHRHSVFGSLSPEFLRNSIICTAPSKTFNLAGLQISNVFIENPAIRKKFERGVEATGYSQMNTMGLISCMAAYRHGGEWLEQLKEYLTNNLALLREFLKERLPRVKLVEPEGTYLVWLDFSELGISQPELDRLITDKANIWLSSGATFGSEGENFRRINIACPRKILEQALLRLEKALKGF